MEKGIGARFQEETKYRRGSLPRGSLDWARRPERAKTYPGAKRIRLVPPRTEGGAPLWKTLRERRSRRDYAARPLTAEEISQILWAAQGATRTSRDFELRTAPSAGALYPVETYAVVQNVEGIDPGVYHYEVRGHELALVSPGDFRAALAAAALNQEFIALAGIVLVWTAVFGRSAWKYRERAYRYVYLDAGHIAQNAALAAEALDLGSCQIAALFDGEVNALVGADGERESVVYMTSVGAPADAD